MILKLFRDLLKNRFKPQRISLIDFFGKVLKNRFRRQRISLINFAGKFKEFLYVYRKHIYVYIYIFLYIDSHRPHYGAAGLKHEPTSLFFDSSLILFGTFPNFSELPKLFGTFPDVSKRFYFFLLYIHLYTYMYIYKHHRRPL